MAHPIFLGVLRFGGQKLGNFVKVIINECCKRVSRNLRWRSENLGWIQLGTRIMRFSRKTQEWLYININGQEASRVSFRNAAFRLISIAFDSR